MQSRFREFNKERDCIGDCMATLQQLITSSITLLHTEFTLISLENFPHLILVTFHKYRYPYTHFINGVTTVDHLIHTKDFNPQFTKCKYNCDIVIASFHILSQLYC